MTVLPRVGFVGLGAQGGPMARRIADAGFPTTLWARRPESLAPYAGTAARVAGSRRELGAASDVLCVCVVDDAGVDEVLRGPEGALAGMADSGVVIIHSTTHPDTCRRLQTDFPNLRVLDAPVSGGGVRAREGTLLVMVGGDASVLERVRPVLDTFAKPLLHIGALGTGQEVKLLNNALFAAHLALAAEVYTLAHGRGLDVEGVATVLNAGSGRSFAADVVAAAVHRLEPLAGRAGSLLAKDVGILADLLSPNPSELIAVADTALEVMGVPRPGRKDPA
ncbi:6-phosphogluconate dehydrogenase NAD-binding [Parafrankia sp. EAN1pec]|uniref:NAD(P)-dependent oxidoreductase n=1 Tax=Parafrankia sp. (strain EAN1pec) TaxID=298653 RepID=UPI00015D9E92|nr:6-phosphogluconate dehydrogenase NAD-binding [Frankia sp. EAN1pec]